VDALDTSKPLLWFYNEERAVLTKFLGKLVSLFVAVVLASLPPALHAQAATDPKPFKVEELDQMLAPIALYPDELLTQVLMASTYPLEVVQAARWRKDAANAKLSGDALTKALESQDWDPSVKALTQFPDVLQTMSDKLDWTQKLGDAFLAQQADVMDRIQFLRRKADEAGTLKSNQQQKVVKETKYIIIEPASPQTVYVPVYQPAVVYGTWWYPAYPPYYWSYGYPGSAFVSGFFWGAGVAVAGSIWGWGRCDWRRNNININVNKYNKINVNRTKITSNNWRHDPKHRGPVPYRDKVSRDKYGARDQSRREAARDFRGFDDKKKIGDKSGAAIKDRKPATSDRTRDAKIKDRPDSRPKQRPTSERARDVPASRTKPSRDVAPARPQSRDAGGAFDVKRGSDVRRQSNRGQASRNAGGHRGGGGAARRSGGGAGHRR
jgi:hypothetical protein